MNTPLLALLFFLPQVYEGLKYHLTLTFPPNYPHEALQVKFETPCFHPNVDTHGNICLDILKEKWSALLDVRTVLLSIQSLLAGEFSFSFCYIPRKNNVRLLILLIVSSPPFFSF